MNTDWKTLFGLNSKKRIEQEEVTQQAKEDSDKIIAALQHQAKVEQTFHTQNAQMTGFTIGTGTTAGNLFGFGTATISISPSLTGLYPRFYPVSGPQRATELPPDYKKNAIDHDRCPSCRGKLRDNGINTVKCINCDDVVDLLAAFNAEWFPKGLNDDDEIPNRIIEPRFEDIYDGSMT